MLCTKEEMEVTLGSRDSRGGEDTGLSGALWARIRGWLRTQVGNVRLDSSAETATHPPVLHPPGRWYCYLPPNLRLGIQISYIFI